MLEVTFNGPSQGRIEVSLPPIGPSLSSGKLDAMLQSHIGCICMSFKLSFTRSFGEPKFDFIVLILFWSIEHLSWIIRTKNFIH